jgi:hypothetical protein
MLVFKSLLEAQAPLNGMMSISPTTCAVCVAPGQLLDSSISQVHLANDRTSMQ